ncbi:MAG: N-acetylmuramoyl-L-alanine amidase, partial [Oscillospiraceae bacterium]|nr:N-acetylmuramoyl-L-alanine amidase [Oscillospiraceae bacterium]
ESIGQDVSRGIKDKYDDENEEEFLMNDLACPTAYCEFGFIDHPHDWALLNTPEKQADFGEAAARGILNYLGVEWQEEVYRFDRFLTQEEYNKIPDESLIVVPLRRYHVRRGVIYNGLHAIANGNVSYKGFLNGKGRGNIHAFPYFPTPQEYDNIPHNSLVITPLRRNHIYGRLHRIANGNLYVKRGGSNRISGNIFLFDHFPTLQEYNNIPRKSLILVHYHKNHVHNGLFRIQNGNSFYKD